MRRDLVDVLTVVPVQVSQQHRPGGADGGNLHVPEQQSGPLEHLEHHRCHRRRQGRPRSRAGIGQGPGGLADQLLLMDGVGEARCQGQVVGRLDLIGVLPDLDGNGTLTFSSPSLSKSITLSPQTSVYFTHRQDSGQNAVRYAMENNRYASSGHVNIGFSFYENVATETLPKVYISVTSDNQSAACYTRIR